MAASVPRLCGGVFPKDAEIQFYSRFYSWFAEESLRRFMAPPYWPYMPDFGELRNVHAGRSMVPGNGLVADFQDSTHPGDAILIRLQGKGMSICIVWDYEHGATTAKDQPALRPARSSGVSVGDCWRN